MLDFIIKDLDPTPEFSLGLYQNQNCNGQCCQNNFYPQSIVSKNYWNNNGIMYFFKGIISSFFSTGSDITDSYIDTINTFDP